MEIGILLHNHGVPGVALFIVIAVVIGICIILLGPSITGWCRRKSAVNGRPKIARQEGGGALAFTDAS
ncbi:MAG: hypothetical protein EPN77_04290 [Candidimonas sp.]|nr:MAG: hypothetical protein EPN77_04290 [Candidimonas sp.]